MSVEAKLLYGMMLDRMSLSVKNEWYDEDGRVYIYFTVEEICDDMTCGRDKAMKLLAELDTRKGIGLMLDVAGFVVTADAMSCQKEIVKKISSKQADYVLSLKENQPTFRHEVEEYFEDALKNPQQYLEVEVMRTKDSVHGRVENRSYYLSTEVDRYADKVQWENFRSIGMVCSRVECNEKVSTDRRYFISAENMAVVRHIALNILRNHPSKASLARKRRRCAYDDAFFADVIRSIHA